MAAIKYRKNDISDKSQQSEFDCVAVLFRCVDGCLCFRTNVDYDRIQEKREPRRHAEDGEKHCAADGGAEDESDDAERQSSSVAGADASARNVEGEPVDDVAEDGEDGCDDQQIFCDGLNGRDIFIHFVLVCVEFWLFLICCFCFCFVVVVSVGAVFVVLNLYERFTPPMLDWLPFRRDSATDRGTLRPASDRPAFEREFLASDSGTAESDSQESQTR